MTTLAEHVHGNWILVKKKGYTTHYEEHYRHVISPSWYVSFGVFTKRRQRRILVLESCAKRDFYIFSFIILLPFYH